MQINFSILYLLIFSSLTYKFINGARPFTTRLTHVEYNYTKGLVDLYSEVVFNKTLRRNVLNVMFDVPKDMIGKLMVFVAYYHKMGNVFIPVIKNVSFNLCEAFQKQNLPSIIKVFLQGFLNSTDLPRRCPIRKGVYHVKNYFLNEEHLPPYLPKVRAKGSISVNLLFRKIFTPYANISIYAQFIANKN